MVALLLLRAHEVRSPRPVLKNESGQGKGVVDAEALDEFLVVDGVPEEYQVLCKREKRPCC